MFFHISTSVPAQSSQHWGDLAYATDLARALADLGHGTRVYRLFEPIQAHPGATIGNPDVVVRIAGPHLDDPVPGLINFAWLISHAEKLFPALLASYDRVFTAARNLPITGLNPPLRHAFLPQATDCSRFIPVDWSAAGPAHQVSFVGNFNAARGDRWPVLAAARAGLPLAVWGHGWKGTIPARMWLGERLNQQELAVVYAGSRIVLNAHMGEMARLGMMSNRSYDALAAGARVITDPVAGYEPGTLPGMSIARDPADLLQQLQHILAAPAAGLPERQAQHDHIATAFSFAAVARRLAAEAAACAAPARRQTTEPTESGRPLQAYVTDLPDIAGDPPASVRFCRGPDDIPAEGTVLLATPALAAALPWGTILNLLLAPPARQIDARTSRYRHHAARLDRIAQCFAAGCPVKVHGPGTAPEPLQDYWAATCAGLVRREIHHVDADQHHLVAALLNGAGPDDPALSGIFARCRAVARRLDLAIPHGDSLRRLALPETMLTRIYEGLPLFPGGEPGSRRHEARRHITLPPLRKTLAPPRPIGVFLHLYYDELAPVFATELQNLNAPCALYISTDTPAKAERIALAFPGAEIRLSPNRGRDIYPKLWLFADCYARHDLVLHLHGKRSKHSDRLDGWLRHNLDSLLGSKGQVNRILSVFRDLPQVGLIAPAVFRPVLPSLHWTVNYRLAAEITRRLGQADPPPAAALRFPAGSMFWARSAALAPLLRLDLRPEDFPAEQGQLDGTLAHAIERMIGVTCERAGFRQVFLAPPGFAEFRRYRQVLSGNGALAELPPEAPDS